MGTRRYPGLAKEYVDAQRRGVANPPAVNFIAAHKSSPSFKNCPVCLEALEGEQCPNCGWMLEECCERCGCSEMDACAGGCAWVRRGLCTSCATPGELAAAGLSIQL